MAPHSSTLAWKIPWAEEPGKLQSMGSLRVGHDWATCLSLFTFMHWRRKWQPTPVFLPGESQGRGAWWAAVYGVTQSRTWLKWLSSSSSSRGCEEVSHYGFGLYFLNYWWSWATIPVLISHLYVFFWASLMPQLVKNPPAMWETWVLSLGWDDPLEKGTDTHSCILAWRIPLTV